MPFIDGVWRPNLKQERFLALPTTIREAIYAGGVQSGKSEVLLMYAIVNKWHELPGFKQVFMRRTFPELKNEIVPRSKLIYPKFGGKFNKIDMVWEFESGALIFLGHCQHEDDVQKYDSMEINLFTPDEVTSLLYSQYMYIGFTRVRAAKNSGLPALIRGAGMPGGVGHTWVKNRFIKPYPSGGKILIDSAGNKRIFIFATYVDNMKYGDPNYGQQLEALPEAEKQAKKYGSFDSYEGQVFTEFRDRHLPTEPPNACHVIEPFVIPNWWPKICAIDWGFKAKCSVGWGAISPDKKLYVYRHQYWYGKKISEWAPEVRFFVNKDQPADIVICHSANQHRGDPHTILEQVSDELETSVRLGEKDRLGGKLLLHEYLRWQQRPDLTSVAGTFDPDLAQWIYRNKSKEDYELYCAAYNKSKEPENIPRVQFFNTSDVMLICDAIKACTYAKTQKDGKAVEDVAEFEGDDEYDMLRMLIHAADQFFDMAADTANKLEITNKVIQNLNETGDMTSYYRQMQHLDGIAKMEQKPMQLFHRGRR